MTIHTKYGLPFVEIKLIHNKKSMIFENFLIDTGSSSTLIAAEIAVNLGLGPEPNDLIRKMIGVGGTEFVYEKLIDRIQLGSRSLDNFTIQIGDMDYGLWICNKWNHRIQFSQNFKNIN